MIRRQVIAVVKAVEIFAVATEESETRVERVEFVEVEAELEDAVAEPVLLGREAMVHHGAIVEAGTERCSAGFQTGCIAGFQTRVVRDPTHCRFGNRRYSRLGSLRYRALVHSQILSPLTARLQSSAEAKASSWKPNLK